MVDLVTPPKKIKPSKKPWPDRDWEKMPGTLLGPETIKAMRPDALHRDVYSEKQRLEAWSLVNDYHMWSRENNPDLPPDTGIYLFSAPMGEGKSLLMITIAMMAWMFRAVPVFSSESMGALFGYQLSLPQVYNFPDVIPPGSILLLDEIAALADAHSGQANRGRVLHAGLTSFRKSGNLALTASAAESHISWQIRVATKGVIKPQMFTPTKKVITAYDYRGRPKVAKMRLRESELKYHKFCYLRAQSLRQPWQGRMVWEDYRQALRDFQQSRLARSRGHSQLDQRWKVENVPTPSPYYMDLAAKLYDTYARVPISDALSLGAQQMQEMAGQLRAARDGHTQEAQVANFITWAIQHRVFAGYAGVGSVPYDDILMVARKHDPRAFEGFSKAALRRALGELFPGATSARRISIKALTGDIPMNTSDNNVERT